MAKISHKAVRPMVFDRFLLAQRRGRHTLVLEPVGRLRTQFEALPRRRTSTGPSDPPAAWVLEKLEAPQRWHGRLGVAPFTRPFGASAAQTVRVFKITWPAGGILAPAGDRPEPSRLTLANVEAILGDAQRAAQAANQAAALAFVNRHGPLGVGIPGAPEFPADGVQLTLDSLARLSEWITAIAGVPHRKMRDQRKVDDWVAEFRDALRRLSIDVRWGPGGLIPRFQAPTLLDALCFAISNMAFGIGQLRRCQECSVFFSSARGNKVYCCRACANSRRVRH